MKTFAAIFLLAAVPAMADTTIYVTGNCAVTTSASTVPTVIPTVVPTPAPAPTPVVTPTPTPVVTVAPSLTPAQKYALVVSLLANQFPKYDNTGKKMTDSAFYNLGAGQETVQAALKTMTPQKVAAAIGTVFARYATTQVAAGVGGPGGTSYALAWALGTGEAAPSMFQAALSASAGVKTPVPTKTPVATPIPAPAGPGVG